MEKEKYDLLFKLILIGDSSVGKSNILSKYLKNEFDENSRATVGVEFGTKNILINGKKIKIQIWDTAGEERYRSITSAYYKGAKGAFIVYDITRKQTFDDIDKWRNELVNSCNKEVTIMLIGNKCDLEDQRKVSFEEGKEMCEKYELEYFMEISAKREINNNFMEIAAISLFKDYETNGNEMSLGVLNESVMLNDYSKRERIKRCC